MVTIAQPAGRKKRSELQPIPAFNGDVVEWLEIVLGKTLYVWQAEIIRDLAVTQNRTYRTAFVQVPRKNGKTFLAACLAIAELFLGEERHVYAISDSERNLKSVLVRELKSLIASSSLADSCLFYNYGVEVPETGSFLEAKPNNHNASQGVNPSLVIADEVHTWKGGDVWHGLQMAGAARPDSLLFGITTPGYDLTNIAHDLYIQATTGDETLYSRIYDVPLDRDIEDRDTWKGGNPVAEEGNDTFLDTMALDFKRLPEHEFRRFRLGQWTATASAWLPYGTWDSLKTGPKPDAGTRVWLGFDGSYSGDSTALVGVTADLHVFVVGVWENPGRPDWRVPRDQVEQTIEDAFTVWDVVELLCDPPYWGREIADWSIRWPGRVIEFPTNQRQRMAPACTAFYSAVMEGRMSHDGNPALARHLTNAIVKTSPVGDFITKPDPKSPAKIDLAVAAVIAFSRADRPVPVRSELVVA